MRIRIVLNPRPVDGVDLSTFRAGCEYDTDPLIAAILICEGWAYPVQPHNGPSLPPPPSPVYRK